MCWQYLSIPQTNISLIGLDHHELKPLASFNTALDKTPAAYLGPIDFEQSKNFEEATKADIKMYGLAKDNILDLDLTTIILDYVEHQGGDEKLMIDIDFHKT